MKILQIIIHSPVVSQTDIATNSDKRVKISKIEKSAETETCPKTYRHSGTTLKHQRVVLL